MSSYFCGADRSYAGAFSIRCQISYQGIDAQSLDKTNRQFQNRPLGGREVRRSGKLFERNAEMTKKLMILFVTLAAAFGAWARMEAVDGYT